MHFSKVIIALDYADKNQALHFVDKLEPDSCHLKIGKEMFTHFGPDLVRELHQMGHSVFLDLKFHDIPNTCAKAVVAAAELGVWMVNVHASGGLRMMDAAQEALISFGKDKPLLIGVTVLTSMEAKDLHDIGIMKTPTEQVLTLAGLTQKAGLDGVVCSAHEASLLKETFGKDFQLVTPGIRPLGAALLDQRRVMTPLEAVQTGVDYMVIGRPITQASDPMQVLNAINASINTH